MILVVGAGPTGLGAAARLEELGLDWALLEASDAAGGLSRSFTDPMGFTWDLGGHIEFSRFEAFDRCFEAMTAKQGWLDHIRSSHVLFPGGVRVPFPVQYNLHRLPAAERDSCLAGLLQAPRSHAHHPTYDDWADDRLGAPFKTFFLAPYTRKIWNHDLDRLDCGWVDDKVATPRLDDVMRSIELDEDYSHWGPSHRFRYPRSGGIGALWRELAASLPEGRLRYGARVKRIDGDARTLELAGGERMDYEAVVSTMPLDQLSRCVTIRNAAELATGSTLVRSSVHVIGYGFQGQPPADLAGASWLYSADAADGWFRLTVLSNLSPENAPGFAPHWSILLEIAADSGSEPAAEKMARRGLEDLRRRGLVGASEKPVTTFYRYLDYGYPVPGLGRDKVVEPLLARLQTAGIYSRGRFGAWRYEVSNQDHSFVQGQEAADHIAGGKPEQVVFGDMSSSRSKVAERSVQTRS